MKIAVIGAGPAGLMASIQASLKGAEVTLYEKQEIVGKKLLITGKGRCNITNYCATEELIEAFEPNGKFLYSAFNKFSSKDTIDFVNQLGVATKVERGKRVFPVSDSAKEVRDALLVYAKRLGTDVRTSSRITEILTENSEVTGIIVDGSKYYYDKVILTSGGASYPLTGSNGDGYDLASKLSHFIVKPLPALVPLETKENWPRQLMGLSLRNVSLDLYEDNNFIASEFGEMLFTHFGLSGPIVLTLSRYICKTLRKRSFENILNFSLNLDLKPALSEEVLDARIQRDLVAASKKHMKNSLDKLLPQSIIPHVIELSKIDPEVMANQLSRSDRESLVHTIKNLKITLSKTRPLEEAIVTSGGIKLSEINPKTMESKLISGLYFAGEVMDVDALTGGYNIQAAFSTGFLAGCYAAEK